MNQSVKMFYYILLVTLALFGFGTSAQNIDDLINSIFSSTSMPSEVTTELKDPLPPGVPLEDVSVYLNAIQIPYLL